MTTEIADLPQELGEQRPRLPVIPETHWWSLRARFKTAIPKKVDPKFIAAALDMSEASAKSNVLPALKTLGIIKEDGTTTDLAIKWRDDSQYKSFCDTVRAKVYDPSLLDVAPDASAASLEAARRWFSGHGVGANMVSKAVQLYTLLCEADPNGAAAAKPPKPTNGLRLTKPVRQSPPKPSANEGEAGKPQGDLLVKPTSAGPTLHLNIQIHISPEVTPEQIEAIFASMSKHLKGMSSE